MTSGSGTLCASWQCLEVPCGPPPSLAVQFVGSGTSLSGMDVELVGSRYRMSLVKKRFATGNAGPDSWWNIWPQDEIVVVLTALFPFWDQGDGAQLIQVHPWISHQFITGPYLTIWYLAQGYLSSADISPYYWNTFHLLSALGLEPRTLVPSAQFPSDWAKAAAYIYPTSIYWTAIPFITDAQRIQTNVIDLLTIIRSIVIYKTCFSSSGKYMAGCSLWIMGRNQSTLHFSEWRPVGRWFTVRSENIDESAGRTTCTYFCCRRTKTFFFSSNLRCVSLPPLM